MNHILTLLNTIFTMVGTFFETLYLHGEVIVDRLIEAGDEELTHLQHMLLVIVIGPPLWFVFGILMSCFGNWIDWVGLITLGRMVMAGAGILFALTSLYVWLRMYTLAHLLVAVSYAVSRIPIPRLQDTGPSPGFHVQAHDGVVSGGLTAGTRIWWDHVDVAIRSRDVMRYLRIVMGLMFWFTFVAIYACVFPVYANLLYFMIVLLAGLALGFATVYWELNTPWLRRLSLAFIVLVILFASFNFSQSITASKSLEHHERMQKIYQGHHDMASKEMEDILKAKGLIKAEKDPKYREKQRTLALLENRMGMKGRLFAYFKRHALSTQDEWNSLADELGIEEDPVIQVKAPVFHPSPTNKGAPLTPPAAATAPEPEPDEPEPAPALVLPKPKISSADKAKLQAFLKAMEDDKKKRDEVKQKLKAMDL